MMFEGQENMLSIQLSNTTCCNLLKKTFNVSQKERKKKKCGVIMKFSDVSFISQRFLDFLRISIKKIIFKATSLQQF